MTSRSHPIPRFLPVGLERLLEDLGRDVVDPQQRAAFERFGRIWVALLHLGMRADILELERAYQPFDPDLEVLPLAPVVDRRSSKQELIERVSTLLEDAHFVEATPDDLDRALTKTSPIGLAVSVDLEQLDVFKLYYRGVEKRTSQHRDPRSLWLRWKEHEMLVFRRVFLLIDLKPGPEAGVKPDPEPGVKPGADEGVGGMDPDKVYLKLFKDVPFSDLEMLLPNTKVRMTGFDKLRLGITGGGGTLGGVVATVTKVGAAASPMTWAIALGGLGAVLWRQLSKVFTQRTKYMATLAQRLYFHTLDNGFGVLTRLVELAEAEESKEALLAAALLVRHGEQSAEELDRRAEAWTREAYGFEVDYDVRGGLAKLRAAGLLAQDGEQVSMLSFDEAFARLDETWDAVFTAQGTPGASGSAGPALSTP